MPLTFLGGNQSQMKFKSPYRVYIVVTALVLLIGISSLAYGLMTASITIPCTGSIAIQSVSLLHTSGTELYDSNNSIARLYLTTIHDGQGFHMSQSDIQNIKSMGFKGIRFFVYWGICETSPSTVSTAYFSSGTGEPGSNAIDNLVNWCKSSGLYIMLCPGWTTTWNIPSWASSSAGTTTFTTAGGGGTIDLANQTTLNGINYLYGWMANRYASYANVVFESFNELQVSNPATTLQRTTFSSFNNGWISAIEANEGSINHIKVIQLLYDWSQWNYVLQTSSPATISVAHSNIIFATHSYPLDKSSLSVANGCENAWVGFVHGQNYPIMDTEHSHCLGGGFAGLQQATTLLVNYNNVGWGYFVYEYSGNSDNTANVNNPTYGASILPILQPYMASYTW